jgi:Na+/proline symporter
MGRPDHRPEHVVTTARRCLLAIGVVVMTYAVIGALIDPDVKFGALIFLIGVLVAHDGLLLPLTLGAGILVGRYAPRRVRALVRAALVVGLAVTIVAFPLVLGRGRAADNPSVLPLHYGRGLLEIYAVVWAMVAAAAGVRAWRDHRRRAVPPDRESSSTATP